ncbi:MFS transporter [Streptomyces sp. NBC_01465]|uniref:MFS transporter n=1 Tax=Streptomyces sp. NBC_01465 TaxID=2903878 RepID=UPI002E301D3C|nr:MFS transporter [Streptomyces sp. NBC_01465]
MTATDAAVIAAAAPERPAHRDGNVLRWLGAFTASTVGDNICFLALSWAAVRSGSPTQAGLVLAVGAVPRALLMLGGGVVADRFGPWKVVIGSDAARAAVILGMALTLVFTSPTLWLLVAVALVFGVVDALFMPAVGALPPRIVGPGQLARLQGLRGIAYRVGGISGASLGGVAVALGGSAAAFAAAGLLFALSLPLLLGLKVAQLPAGEVTGENDSAWRQLADGIRYIRHHRVLAPLMLLIAVGEIGFAGPANIGLTLLAKERGWGASGMGWIVAAFGLGAGGAALFLAVRGRVPYAGLVQSYALIGGAAAIAGLAYASSVALAALAGFAIGALAGFAGSICSALTQTQTDPGYMGRVSSVSNLLAMGIAPLCYPLTGAAIGVWGTTPVFVTSAAVCAAGALLGLASRELRHAELPR